MFSKSKSEPNKTSAQVPQQKPSVPSIISANLTVTGNLVSDGEVQIDGAINGDIKTDTLLIGEAAHIKGEIHAKHVRVHGRVDGQITAQAVVLAKTAHVTGDVIHEDLSIEKGAFLEGRCMRMSDAKPATVTPTAEKVGMASTSTNPKPAIADKDKTPSGAGTMGKTVTA